MSEAISAWRQQLSLSTQAPAWSVAGPDTVRPFSAACYYMVQDLRKRTGVPIGACSRASLKLGNRLASGRKGGGVSAISWLVCDPATSVQ